MKSTGHISILITVTILTFLLSSCVYEDLSAPTGVNAQARVEQVYIEWSKVKGAKSYTIYFSTTPNQKISKKTRIMGIKNTYYNHSGLIGYKTYYYTVVAVDEEGFNSDGSIEVDATPNPENNSSSSSSSSDNDSGSVSSSACGSTICLPKTGQTTSYASNDDGELQRGLSWPSPRFTVSGDCVTDNLTGLMWTKNGNLYGSKTWTQAISDANGLSLCGYDDWRLPNVNELESLVNSEQSNSATWLNGQGFTGVQSNYYWSSTTYATSTSDAWNVVMIVGNVYNVSKTNSSRYVWPVRSGGSSGYSDIWKTGQTISYATGDDGDLQKGVAWPSPRFTDNSDGTVTDNLTGLMWLKDANCFGTQTWSNALTSATGSISGCSGYTASYSYWRLPNKKELRTLVDYLRYSPSLQTGHPFINVQSSDYWSSTTYADSTSSAWDVSMGYSNVNGNVKTGSRYVWPVR